MTSPCTNCPYGSARVSMENSALHSEVQILQARLDTLERQQQYLRAEILALQGVRKAPQPKKEPERSEFKV